MSSRPCRPNPVFLTPLVGRGRGIALRRRWLFRDALDFAEAEARKAREAEKADSISAPDDLSDDEFVVLAEPEPTVEQMPNLTAVCPKTAAKVETLVHDVTEATRGIRLMKSDLDDFAEAVKKWLAEVEAREARLKKIEQDLLDLQESISRLTVFSELTSDAVIKLFEIRSK